MTHTFLDETIEYNIVHKQRKSIGVFVDAYGQILVHGPKGIKPQDITPVLEKHWDEILQKSKEMKARLNGPAQKTYDPGELFLYLGEPCPIIIFDNTSEEQDYVKYENKELHVYVKLQEDEPIKLALKRFYFRQCKTLVESRMKKYQSEFKVKPRALKITSDTKTWGTCNSNRDMTFNWKLAMAPVEVIDYVVVHEMCHMVHLNHDRSFWRLVGKIMPDYELRSNWLSLSNWKMQA